ncbi:hypothetical protein, partial [Bartonella sp. TS25HLJMH]|uniref:hypothetical protein n=1 Tax=Bartonella sp. TS25HLJMH TaxID=3243576 RepID=UPI0035CF7072
MTNVFKKRTSLYALTTSALFFLQGVDSSMEVMGNRLLLPSFGTSLSYANAVTPSPAAPSPAAPSSGESKGIIAGGASGTVRKNQKVYLPITSCHSSEQNAIVDLGSLMSYSGNSVPRAGAAVPRAGAAVP